MAKRLLDKKILAHFIIVGGQIYDTSGETKIELELKSLAKSLGVENRVHFTGFRKDIPQALNSVDILVHGSIEPEPFGRVIVEAFACGAVSCPHLGHSRHSIVRLTRTIQAR